MINEIGISMLDSSDSLTRAVLLCRLPGVSATRMSVVVNSTSAPKRICT